MLFTACLQATSWSCTALCIKTLQHCTGCPREHGAEMYRKLHVCIITGMPWHAFSCTALVSELDFDDVAVPCRQWSSVIITTAADVPECKE